MSLDPRTPILVGVGVATQHEDDPTVATEALELMARAVDAAAADAGSTALVATAGYVGVPEGTWAYPDPGRLLAERVGAAGAVTAVADVGILQQDLIAEACRQVASGDMGVAVVVGGEARYRALRGRVEGVEPVDTVQPEGTAPDRRIEPASLGIHELEMTRNAVTPSTAYALIEQARRARLGATPEEHRARLGSLGSSFAAVAAANPHAWDRHPWSADEVVTADAANRMISWPYTKRMCSQWNVDQAAALVVCSVEAAERFGVARDRWVFPWSSAVSNHAVPVIQRDAIDASPGADAAAARALLLAGLGIDDVAHLDLYSCFPAAVQCFADALGVPIAGRDLTVTGGMAFAGGPLNNYVLQAMAELADRLRAEPGSVGLSSSVSTYLTKQGFGIWSTEPPPHGFRHEDVSAEAARVQDRPVDAGYAGPATVASWTVDHQAGVPWRAVVVCEVDGGARTLASTTDADTCAAMLVGEWIGAAVEIDADGSFSC